MIRVMIGIFLVLHGIVHLLYMGQSRRKFELQPGLVWPDESWILSKTLDTRVVRLLATISCLLAAFGFIIGAAGLFLGQSWGRVVVAGAAFLSSLLFVVFWDGSRQKLANQGGVAILINLGILLALPLMG